MGLWLLPGGWASLWHRLLLLQPDPFKLYVLGSTAALLASYWTPVIILTLLVRQELYE